MTAMSSYRKASAYINIPGIQVSLYVYYRQACIVMAVTGIGMSCFVTNKPCRVGSVVRVSASHTVGHGLMSWLVHTKDHHKNGTKYLPAWHTCIRVGV